jgi:hypothetical protein
VAFSVGGLAEPITMDGATTNRHRFITGDADIEGLGT